MDDAQGVVAAVVLPPSASVAQRSIRAVPRLATWATTQLGEAVSTETESPGTPPPVEDLLIDDLLVLVSGNERARALFSRHGVRGIQTLSQGEVAAEGLPPGGARRLAGAFELARRLAERRLPRGLPFTSSGQVFEAFHERLRHLRVEQFWLVFLDAKNRVQREVMLSQGTLTNSLVHPRELFRLAIREAAVSVVLVHNHPSGDPEPSTEDQDLTRRLEAVGELVGIRVVDHIVIGDGAYVSFLERGWIRT